MPFDKEQNWVSLPEAFKKETDIRENIDIDKLCTFGIKPLDDAFICILKDDLIVIGADSGIGKSTLALSIARTNIQKGKKVALYYLEGGYEEAISKMKWRDIIEEYYKNYHCLGIDINYQRWALNIEKHGALKEIECKVWDIYKEKYQDNLFFYNSKQGLTVDSLITSLLDFEKLIPNETNSGITIKIGLDLIIIDHLQYFSLTKAESEIFEITEILRTVKNIANHHKIPVILISHLKKRTKDRGCPNQEDFYGSSNIPKIASTAIIIAPDPEKDNFLTGIYPTYFRVVKSRVGIRSNYACMIDFDLHKNSYAENYEMYRIDTFGNIYPDALKEEEKPKWAKIKPCVKKEIPNYQDKEED